MQEDKDEEARAPPNMASSTWHGSKNNCGKGSFVDQNFHGVVNW